MRRTARTMHGFSVAIVATLMMGMLAACGAGEGTTGGATVAPVSTTAARGAATVAGGAATAAGGAATTGGAGLASQFSAGKGCKRVGFLLPDSATGSRFVIQDQPLTEAAIKKYLPGVTVESLNAQNSNDTQLTQATSLLTKGACILVVVAVDSVAAAAVVQKAKQSNVPVIAYDRLIQDNDLAFYASFDNVAVGRAQGEYIKANYKKGDNVAMINGSMTDNNALLFAQGAHEVLDPLFMSGELKKVYEQYTPMWSPETAQVQMAAALTMANNNIQIAYIANDAMANTSIAALKAQSLNGKVLVTGQDAETVGARNILLGDQAMTVYKPIKNLSDTVGKLVAAISNDMGTKELTPQTSVTTGKANIPSALLPVVTATKANLKDTVLADNYVKKEDICMGVPAGAGGIC